MNGNEFNPQQNQSPSSQSSGPAASPVQAPSLQQPSPGIPVSSVPTSGSAFGQSPNLPQKPKRKWLTIFLIILVLVGLVLGVIFLLKIISGLSSDKVVDPNPNIPKPVEPLIPMLDSDPFPEDIDRDGISNEQEEELGLNPREFDTDGDGLSDYDEINFLKTDPKSIDTDKDGTPDGMELVQGTDPLVSNASDQPNE